MKLPNWLSRLTKHQPIRNTLSEGYLSRVLGVDLSNLPVNKSSALTHSAYLSCIRVISETIGSLSRHTYRKTTTGRESISHKVGDWINESPNPMVTAPVFWETFIFQMLHNGNGLAHIMSDGLYLMDAANTKIVRSGNQLYYVTRLDNDEPLTLRADQVLHVPSPMTLDGCTGVPAIDYLKRSLKLSMASESFATRYFEHGTHLGHVIEMDGNPPKEKREEFKQSLQEFHQGLVNSHSVVVLPAGVHHKPVGVEPEKSQLIELRQFQIGDVARIFRIPQVFIGEWGRATWSNSAESDRFLVKYTLTPYLTRIEKEINRKLFTNREQQAGYFVKFEIDSLLRGDQSSRYEAYAIGRQWGWLSQNDIRIREDMAPIEGGDTYLSPGNMVNVTEIANQARAIGEAGLDILREDAERRVATKLCNAVTRKIPKSVDEVGQFATWFTDYMDKQVGTVRDMLWPLAVATNPTDPEAECKRLLQVNLESPREQLLAACESLDQLGLIAEVLSQWQK
jgi:HK97 family phage portal protein